MQQLDLTGMPKKFAPGEGNNGMFGYDGKCTDIALAKDDADMIERCFKNDWIDFDTKMFTGCSITHHAKRAAPKCYERLVKLGFPKA